MKKIVPHLWYDKDAFEAAKFYTSLFEDSAIVHHSSISDTPSGTADLLTIVLAGQEFMMISAGPYFQFTPAISLRVDCATKEEVDTLWNQLSVGGSALMELDSYPFSERYGWTTDRYGLNWQIMYVKDPVIRQKITPTLMFVGDQCGKAEEAIRFYTSVFKNAKVGEMDRYGSGEEPDKEGTVRYAGFSLEGMLFAAMDSAYDHDFSFNEAISFVVSCESQMEIDYFWDKLSYVPEAEQCGWLKDRFGVSWQIVPAVMEEMMASGDSAAMQRVTEAFLMMKKFDIAALAKAFEG
ncbi:MAG: VOC family protein [Eubacteriales bacterium]